MADLLSPLLGCYQKSLRRSMRGWLVALEQGLARGERSAIYGILRDAVPYFDPGA